VDVFLRHSVYALWMLTVQHWVQWQSIRLITRRSQVWCSSGPLQQPWASC